MDYIELNNEMLIKKDGFYQLEMDRKAVKAFELHVAQNYVEFDTTLERLNFLIKNNYYYDVFQEYSKSQVIALHEYLNHRKVKFKSFMAISKFYTDYAMKTNDGKKYLETYEERLAIIALYLARGNFDKALFFADQLIKQNYQPATPTTLNAGKARRGELVSCFLLDVDDSLNSIGFYINTSMQLSKIGGGVALNLSKLRSRGEPIKEVEGAAKGVVPVMKLLEDSFAYADQMGQRKGAGAAYLNIFHWDIIEFLDTKKINADEKSRIASLSLGLIAPNKFFELAEKNEDFYVFAPYSVRKEYGKHLDNIDIDNLYDELIANPNIVKKKCELTARQLLTRIAATQLESGYPYFMNKTNANNQHALKEIGEIQMSNLCTEIFQLQETSEITDYEQEDVINRDINCNLGSLNIVNVMENKEVKESVYAGMEMLTAVSDMSSISNAPTVKKANEELHSVGLGAMNLHGFFAKNGIAYESEDAKDFANTFFMMMNFYSIQKSMLIAKERGIKFAGFEKSEYANGNYFAKYISNDYSPKFEKVYNLFEGMHIPTTVDWAELMIDVMEYGMYNAYRLAIAPTGSISYIQNSTQSLMPAVSPIEERTYANASTYYPMPFLSPKTNWFYAKSAYNMNQFKVMDLIMTVQQHVDQGISCTLHVNSDISTRELARYYIYANKIGLKSLYYTRTNKLSLEECLSCQV